MVQPRLLLKDNRKLVFSVGPARRNLRDIRAADVVAGGDERSLKIPEESEDRAGDTGVDFAYKDEDGQRVAVEFKLASGFSRNVVQDGLAQVLRYANSHSSKYDRVELWTFDKKSSTLSIWSPNANVPSQVFGLSNIISANDRWVPDRREMVPFDSAYVESRVNNWRDQIANLFEQLSNWSKQANYSTDQTGTVEMDEELMKLFSVPPARLPILKIGRGRKIIATVIPVGLWVVGANGRVDVLAERSSATVVNESKPSELPRWVIYFSGSDISRPLDQHLFLNFLAQA